MFLTLARISSFIACVTAAAVAQPLLEESDFAETVVSNWAKLRDDLESLSGDYTHVHSIDSKQVLSRRYEYILSGPMSMLRVYDERDPDNGFAIGRNGRYSFDIAFDKFGKGFSLDDFEMTSQVDPDKSSRIEMAMSTYLSTPLASLYAGGIPLDKFYASGIAELEDFSHVNASRWRAQFVLPEADRTIDTVLDSDRHFAVLSWESADKISRSTGVNKFSDDNSPVPLSVKRIVRTLDDKHGSTDYFELSRPTPSTTAPSQFTLDSFDFPTPLIAMPFWRRHFTVILIAIFACLFTWFFRQLKNRDAR